jgi:hypothetical protein
MGELILLSCSGLVCVTHSLHCCVFKMYQIYSCALQLLHLPPELTEWLQKPFRSLQWAHAIWDITFLLS